MISPIPGASTSIAAIVLVRPLDHLDRLVIHMDEFRADDPLELRDQPLLDPLVEEGEIFLSFLQ